jgi:hypothetical protein
MKKDKPWLYLFGLFALLLIIPTTLLLNREKQGEFEVSFETIEMAEIPGTGFEYPGREPALVIITSRDDIPLLGKNVSKHSQSFLNPIDFSGHFVLTVFQGIKGTNLYGVEIQHIFQKGNVITIYAHFTERDPSVGAGTIMTSPYHIVKVSRQGLVGPMEFVLLADGEEIIRQTHYMP